MSLNLSHLPYARLVDWVDGRLAPEQQVAVTAHLDACSHCRAEAAQVERMLNAMRTDDSQDAPPSLIARALQSFRHRVVAPSPSLVQRLVAVLRFESTPLTPALGLRGEGAAERQLVFTAADYDVDLRIVPAVDGWQVSGQLLGDELGAGVAHLTSETFNADANIDPLSTFELPPAPAGHYTLTLAWPAFAITVENLALGIR